MQQPRETRLMELVPTRSAGLLIPFLYLLSFGRLRLSYRSAVVDGRSIVLPPIVIPNHMYRLSINDMDDS